MIVAITGAAGYTGSLLVAAHCARGDEVRALARNASAIAALPGVIRYAADLTEPDRVPAAFFDGAETLYHCAAELTREALMERVNVDAVGALIAGARGRIGHWVQVSSLSVYGHPRAGVVTEDSALRPASLYARTKGAADALLAGQAGGAFSYTIVRPSAIIGRGMRNRSMRALIDAVARGRFAFIGAPGAIGNDVHEENVVAALVLCGTLAAARGRTYNVSQNCPIETVVETIAASLGTASPRARIPETLARLAAQAARVLPAFPLTPGRVAALTSRVEYRTDRIESELGYRPRKTIEDALRDLVGLHRGLDR